MAIILSNIFLNNKYNERYINDVKANLSYSNSFNVQLNDNLKNNKENKINFSVFSPSHTGLYFTGIKMFIDKPITGHGFRMFRISCKNYKEAKNNCSTHPHNWYIEIISETGVINFFIIFSLFIYLIFLVINNFHWFYNKKNYSQNLYIISLGLLILYNPLRPSGSFFNNFNMILNSLLFALFLIQLRIDKK